LPPDNEKEFAPLTVATGWTGSVTKLNFVCVKTVATTAADAKTAWVNEKVLKVTGGGALTSALINKIPFTGSFIGINMSDFTIAKANISGVTINTAGDLKAN
jgi:hypothetical protein